MTVSDGPNLDGQTKIVPPVRGIGARTAGRRGRTRGAAGAATVLASLVGLAGIDADGAAARPVSAATTADFGIRFGADVQSVVGGDTAIYTFDIVASSRFAGAVVFDLPNLTDGFAGRVIPETSTHLRLEVRTPPFANTNSGVFRLRGRSGSLSREALFRLNVTARPVPTTTLPVPSATLAPQFTLSTPTTSVSVLPDQTAQFGVTVSRTGYAGPVDLRIDGLPKGAVANFSPNPTVEGSVLYVTPSTATSSGTYLLSIVGQAGSTVRALAVSLVVRRSGDFSLALAPSSISVPAANDAVVAVNVSPRAGSTSPVPPDVTFNATGLPLGAVALFDPNPSNGLTSVRIRTAQGTPAGKYKIAIKGTSGQVTRNVTLTLTVQKSAIGGFGLSASPATATVTAGTTTAYALAISPAGGFNSTVDLVVKNLPPFATAKITNQTATSANIQILTLATTPTGTFPLQITGTSGALSATVQVNLVVTS